MRYRILAATLVLAPALRLAGDTPKGKPASGPKNACTTCTERRATLDPKTFEKGWDAEVAPGYEIARKIPATLDKLHCFCECAESPTFKHKTLLTCFVDTHAAGCGICLSEARLAWQLKARGASDEEIQLTVESVHKTDGHPPTHAR